MTALAINDTVMLRKASHSAVMTVMEVHEPIGAVSLVWFDTNNQLQMHVLKAVLLRKVKRKTDNDWMWYDE